MTIRNRLIFKSKLIPLSGIHSLGIKQNEIHLYNTGWHSLRAAFYTDNHYKLYCLGPSADPDLYQLYQEDFLPTRRSSNCTHIPIMFYSSQQPTEFQMSFARKELKEWL